MQPLLEALPTEVEIGGRAFAIRSDWRTGVRFETMAFDRRVPEVAKLALALGLYYPVVPEDIEAATDAMMWFYRCGKPESGGTGEQPYSFEHDWDSLFAGFLGFGVDLLDPGANLHWWRFRSLLLALPEDSQFMRIVGYRVAEVTGDMDPEYRKHLTRMKRLYALPSDAAPPRLTSQEAVDAAIAEVVAAKRLAMADA